ncbi:hypothetical protein FE257_012948 [Aspergillus nanangensis]|uniref:Nucleoside phosphorylase domain-containing protein n=1 Tax=Aspergillus nanangensis TaxID=2582783 RepID=A0AAD4CF85_ASPNN|nr:hypothetical protein FE257_012948 [Aspergillus nanangensis]
MSSINDYTVAWICAIAEEYTAAIALLDKQYEPPQGFRNNLGEFTFGRIGKHNVAIGVCGKGDYGTTSAAWVSKIMITHLPKIQYGLVVGVAGGVPSRRHDIRLGDVVVSVPSNGNSGMLHYGGGEYIQGGGCKYRTSHLPAPPQALLSAVKKLEHHHRHEGHKLNGVVERAFAKWTRLQRKYRRPDPGTDRLYRSDSFHSIDSDGDCGTHCDHSGLVLRPRRTRNPHDPVIHHGLIASGDLVVKDSQTRDRLGMEKDILCFEMEAAGAMSVLPCLAVRGICDYADSHKNKDWQGYAAMVAAAYAKDVLYQV